MQDADVRTALIGFGMAGEIFHAPLIDATPGMSLSTIVTSDPERAARARQTYPAAEVLGAANDPWERSRDLDLVVVAAPTRAHARLALDAIGAGLAVVVDKPFTVTSAEAESVIRAARENHVPLSVFQNRRWDGDFRTARRLISAGRLGAVTRYESRYEAWRPQPRPGWRLSGDPADAGGLLFDLGSHLIDQSLVLFGTPVRVYGQAARRRPQTNAVDDVFVALEHRGNVYSHLWMSHVATSLGPRLRVIGDRASYVKFGMDVQEAALRDGRRPDTTSPQDTWGSEPDAAWGTVHVGADETLEPTDHGCYQRFYEMMATAVRGDGPVPVDADDALDGIRVIEAAMLSAGEHRVVPFG